MLKETLDGVQIITESMNNVAESARQVNQAMSVSAQDAENLHAMTQVIHSDALQSAENAKQISHVDEDLSKVAAEMVDALIGGVYAISNQELIANLQKAKTAHENWVNSFQRIVTEMQEYPLQTDSKRCAFGHFYHAIHMKNAQVLPEWQAIDEDHRKLHAIGIDVVGAVRNHDKPLAESLLRQAEDLSLQVISHIDRTINILQELSKRGIEVLR
jgi:hypothetical protein